jgi:hypothetical protein
MHGEPEVAGATRGLVAAAEREAPPDREVRNPFFRYLVHLGLPLSISLAVHLGVIGFLALKTFSVLTRPGTDVGQWEGTVVEAADFGKAFQWTDDNVLPTPVEVSSDTSLESLTPLPTVSDFGLRDLEKPAGGSSAGEGTGLGLGDGSLSLIGTGSGAGETGTGGFGSGLGVGGSQLGRAGIWDLNIRANKVVYVVDFSGSIIVAVDDLKRELKRSIGRLKPSQSFDVIVFYSSGGGSDEKVRTESFKPKLEPADEATRREFFTWIDRKAPMGVTEPLQAIKRALALQPEAIFFFSDGYFDDALIDEIARANRPSQTRIYCLVFDEILLQDTSGLPRRETEGVRRLTRIAEGNRGQIKIVTGKDLAR